MGYGDDDYGDGPWGGGRAPGLPSNFVSPLYPVPLGQFVGGVSVSKFSGEPTSGLLAPSLGQLFFSPALLSSIALNEIDLDDIRIDVDAGETYEPVVVENLRLFTFGPNSPSRTNDAKWRTQPKEFTAIGALVDETNLVILANNLRLHYESHRPDLTYHDNADAVNVIAAAVATDLATSITLLNDIKAKFNGHRTEATIHPTDDVINVITSPDATDAISSAILSNELKTKYNAHRTAPGVHVTDDVANIVGAGQTYSYLETSPITVAVGPPGLTITPTTSTLAGFTTNLTRVDISILGPSGNVPPGYELAIDIAGSEAISIPLVKTIPSLTQTETVSIPVSGAQPVTTRIRPAVGGTIVTVPVASLLDTETFTIDDGTNPATIFEFDVAGNGVGGGNTPVDVSTLTTADDVRDAMITAINGVATLDITAYNVDPALVGLVHDSGSVGTAVAMSDTVADAGFIPAGMSAGPYSPSWLSINVDIFDAPIISKFM
jgi:hypothetical protein